MLGSGYWSPTTSHTEHMYTTTNIHLTDCRCGWFNSCMQCQIGTDQPCLSQSVCLCLTTCQLICLTIQSVCLSPICQSVLTIPSQSVVSQSVCLLSVSLSSLPSLSVSLSVCLTTCQLICLSIQSVCLSPICQSVLTIPSQLSVSLSVSYLSVCPHYPVCQSVCLSLICQSVLTTLSVVCHSWRCYFQ